MIYLLIKGHNQEYSVFNLIKVFFPNENIKRIEDIGEYPDQGKLVESFLSKDKGKVQASTKLYIDGEIRSSNTENTSNVKIPFESVEKKIRIAIRKSLYSVLSSASEFNSPWGILTGVRPMKIVHDLINKKVFEREIRGILKDQYYLKQEKINTMINIAAIQRDYIYPLRDEYSLYISIPFCPSRCHYCSFPSLSIDNYYDKIDIYVEKLMSELDAIKEIMKGKSINTVYIGGGTPTSLREEDLEKIIQKVYSNYGRENIREFTVEAGRPDTLNKSYLEMLKKNDIKRISINPQTMNDKTLKRVGRRHSVEDVVNTYRMAEALGFESINMDLILGLPGESEENISNTMREISKLNPDNLTVHTLSIKTGSDLMEDEMNYSLDKQNTLRNMLTITNEYAKKLELLPYYLYRQKRILGNLENIGFGKKGKECIYNIVMMEEKQTIIGAGMGAVSKIYDRENDKIIRMPNFKSLNEYLNRLDELNIRKQEAIENLI